MVAFVNCRIGEPAFSDKLQEDRRTLTGRPGCRRWKELAGYDEAVEGALEGGWDLGRDRVSMVLIKAARRMSVAGVV